jgi:dimethylhistidine N-methyltransferase
MEQFAAEMGERLGPSTMLVEYGSGSSIKTRDLLDGLIDPTAYVPVDISGEHLRKTAVALARAYPQIEILPVCADFTQPFDLPQPMHEPRQISVYFPGSTIGNFLPDQAAHLLRRIAETCGSGGGLLIGIDLKKNVARIEAAYNDHEGVTAAFNLNLLKRINRELGADFDLANFSHRAHYNHERGRIEMHLVSEARQRVHLAGESFDFVPGETICTEYSHKYTVNEFSAIASTVGLRLDREWTDANRDFAVLYYTMTK